MILPIYAQSFLNLLFGFDINFADPDLALSGQRYREYEHLKALLHHQTWSISDLQTQGIIETTAKSVSDIYSVFKSSNTFPALTSDTMIYNFTNDYYHYCGVRKRSHKYTIDSNGTTKIDNDFGFSQSEMQLYGLSPTIIKAAAPSQIARFQEICSSIKNGDYPFHTVLEGTEVQNSHDSQFYTPWYIVINNDAWTQLTNTRPNFWFPNTRYLALTTSNTTVTNDKENNEIIINPGEEVKYTESGPTRIQLYTDIFNPTQQILTTPEYSDDILNVPVETTGNKIAGINTHNQSPIHFPELELSSYPNAATSFALFQEPKSDKPEDTLGDLVDINAPFVWGPLSGNPTGVSLQKGRIPTIDTAHLVFGFWEEVTPND